MRRALKEALEFCRNMEMNIATKRRKEGKKNVATPDNYVVTKNKENGRKNFVMKFKIVLGQRKREFNEDTLKQRRDIEINYRDINNCRKKYFYSNTSEFSRDRSR